MELAENPDATVVVAELRHPSGMENLRCQRGPRYPGAQTEQLKHGFDSAFAFEKIQDRPVPAAQTANGPRPMHESANTQTFFVTACGITTENFTQMIGAKTRRLVRQ